MQSQLPKPGTYFGSHNSSPLLLATFALRFSGANVLRLQSRCSLWKCFRWEQTILALSLCSSQKYSSVMKMISVWRKIVALSDCDLTLCNYQGHVQGLNLERAIIVAGSKSWRLNEIYHHLLNSSWTWVWPTPSIWRYFLSCYTNSSLSYFSIVSHAFDDLKSHFAKKLPGSSSLCIVPYWSIVLVTSTKPQISSHNSSHSKHSLIAQIQSYSYIIP